MKVVLLTIAIFIIIPFAFYLHGRLQMAAWLNGLEARLSTKKSERGNETDGKKEG